MNDLQINQIVLKLKIKNTSESFDYNKSFDYRSYKAYYHKDIPKYKKGKSTVDNYVVRKTIDFSYTVSRKLVIFLFIFDNFEYWFSSNGFYKLLRNIVDELENFIIGLDSIEFDYNIVNIASSFSIEEHKFLRTLELSVLENYLNEFNDLNKVFSLPLRLLVQGETTNYALGIKGFGTCKIYSVQQRGTIICKSIESLKKLDKFFSDFCKFYSEKVQC